MADAIYEIKRSAAEMVARIKKFKEKFPQVVMQAMRVEAEIEATEVRKRTPVYTGPTGPGKPIPGLLRGSVRVEGPVREGNAITVYIVAGGAAEDYAIPQHENLDYFHEVGQAKYIESVIMESRPYMAARIAKRIDILKAQ